MDGYVFKLKIPKKKKNGVVYQYFKIKELIANDYKLLRPVFNTFAENLKFIPNRYSSYGNTFNSILSFSNVGNILEIDNIQENEEIEISLPFDYIPNLSNMEYRIDGVSDTAMLYYRYEKNKNVENGYTPFNYIDDILWYTTTIIYNDLRHEDYTANYFLTQYVDYYNVNGNLNKKISLINKDSHLDIITRFNKPYTDSNITANPELLVNCIKTSTKTLPEVKKERINGAYASDTYNNYSDYDVAVHGLILKSEFYHSAGGPKNSPNTLPANHKYIPVLINNDLIINVILDETRYKMKDYVVFRNGDYYKNKTYEELVKPNDTPNRNGSLLLFPRLQCMLTNTFHLIMNYYKCNYIVSGIHVLSWGSDNVKQYLKTNKDNLLHLEISTVQDIACAIPDLTNLAFYSVILSGALQDFNRKNGSLPYIWFNIGNVSNYGLPGDIHGLQDGAGPSGKLLDRIDFTSVTSNYPSTGHNPISYLVKSYNVRSADYLLANFDTINKYNDSILI